MSNMSKRCNVRDCSANNNKIGKLKWLLKRIRCHEPPHDVWYCSYTGQILLHSSAHSFIQPLLTLSTSLACDETQTHKHTNTQTLIAETSVHTHRVKQHHLVLTNTTDIGYVIICIYSGEARCDLKWSQETHSGHILMLGRNRLT